jgi:AraC-like DNA-binding protein
LILRIDSFVRAHLADPALRPAEVAADAQISVRHLHRLFARSGITVSDWIRERRLQACRQDLSNPRLYDQSITDIAFSWGFSDSAHFSRSFKKMFGVSPRQFRSTGRSRMTG